MKKLSLLILSVMFALFLCSCGIHFGQEAELKAKVREDAYIYCLGSFSKVKEVHTDITTIEVKDKVYTVYGTARIHDVYNEEHEEKFTAKYLLNGEHAFIKINFALERLQIEP